MGSSAPTGYDNGVVGGRVTIATGVSNSCLGGLCCCHSIIIKLTADEIPGLSGMTELRLLAVGGGSSKDGKGSGLGEERVEEIGSFGGGSGRSEGDAGNVDKGTDVFEVTRGLSRTYR